MKLTVRVAKLEGAAAKLPRPKPIDFENAEDRVLGERLLLASRLPAYRQDWTRLGELTPIGADAMTIPECREFRRLFDEMQKAGAAIHAG